MKPSLQIFFAKKGMTEDAIKKALDMAREASDRLPISGPGGLHGRRSGRSRDTGSPVFRGTMDAKQKRRLTNLGLDRVLSEPPIREAGRNRRNRQAKDAKLAPDRAAVTKLNAKYPGLADIGSM